MAEPIQIVIRKTQETAYQPQLSSTVSEQKSGKSATQKAVNTALVNAGKQIVSAGINQYGNLTGNTLRNKQLDNLTEVAGYIGQIIAGGWVGAIAVATQIGVQGISNYTQKQRSNQEAQLLYERSGNVTINGGRGTND
jgi:hypothetical protein